ncbi:MAG: hypothetical protein U0R64_00420 [Candidatus Nanopelagicales bacterium]
MSTTADLTRRDFAFLRGEALGFGIGSFLFAAGAVMQMAGVASAPVNLTYAAGAVFFTTAAAIQLRAAFAHLPAGTSRWRALVADPDVASSWIQQIGTLAFNVMTIRAVVLPPTAADYGEIWQPDVFGSALFLISSWIAWHPIARARRHQRISWNSRGICWGNMIGSVFFAISAWGAKLLPNLELQSEQWSNAGTLLGAIGFFVASILTWPGAHDRDD